MFFITVFKECARVALHHLGKHWDAALDIDWYFDKFHTTRLYTFTFQIFCTSNKVQA
jgi:hypothetical protein